MACGESKQLGSFLRKRQRLLLFFFYCWIMISILRLADIMIFSQEKILKDLAKTENVELVKPAQRGAIYSQQGTRLAWSEACFELSWRVPVDLVQKKLELERVYNLLNINLLEIEQDEKTVLCYELGTENIVKALTLVKDFDSFSIKEYFKRICVAQVDIVGLVENEQGISGVEMRYDKMLAGQDGIYNYTKRRHKINYQTWNEKQKMIPGVDIIVDEKGKRIRK